MYGSKSQLNCINIRSQSNSEVTEQKLFLSDRELQCMTADFKEVGLDWAEPEKIARDRKK